MNQPDALTAQRIEITTEYFRRVDAGDPAVLDLMSDDVQLYFPKFGVGYGKAAVAESAAGLMTEIATIKHDFDRLNFITSGDYVVVEGYEGGTTKDGKVWPNPERSEGRFCNVFVFDDLLIKRVHVYVDPDFTSSDRARFHWGDTVRRTKEPAAPANN
ncbi:MULTISPECIES: nuclear transport factor 2 family protein [unclassified Devosia]|uniref:nuclear transport factor 2 family protein n=1 Tax=unclassified Devosia TaxID=196773 RepID=UPI0015571942|nr:MULTISPECIES: nuclear transport factor 2 family protein [unclassified Devosia]